ncbi:MAG: MFS transporter [Vicinamibacterales bacterium]
MSLRSSRPVAVALVTFATFTDILAYAIAVPVLPDISKRFGASPTVIGLLFASFGLTVLLTSIPMGTLSDRTGRRLPLVGGMMALAASSVLFAFAPAMSWLFAARLMLGAADATTWVVGFSVVADLYPAERRGRVLGFVMSGSTVAFLIGPAIGGWLYDAGGPRLPYLVVALCALVSAVAFAAIVLPVAVEKHQPVPLRTIVASPAVTVCTLAVGVGGGTIAMLEPVLALHLSRAIGLEPARIGMVFGAGALVAAFMHPLFGRLADRLGGRRLTLAGVAAIGLMLPALTLISSFPSAIVIYATGVVAVSMMVAPSLAYMAEAVSTRGPESFGVAYGLYNFAWALGIIVGPAVGAALYERIGFAPLMWRWAPVVVVASIVLARVSRPSTTHIA